MPPALRENPGSDSGGEEENWYINPDDSSVFYDPDGNAHPLPPDHGLPPGKYIYDLSTGELIGPGGIRIPLPGVPGGDETGGGNGDGSGSEGSGGDEAGGNEGSGGEVGDGNDGGEAGSGNGSGGEAGGGSGGGRGNGTGTKDGQGSDGILVWDRNDGGNINNGTELFGDSTVLEDGSIAKSGFEALADLDSSGDGVIDASDENFSNLKIWIDSNGDGIATEDELKTLQEFGIKAIHLSPVSDGTMDENGNIIARTGTFEWEDDTLGLIGEMNLNADPMRNIPVEYLALPEDIAALPELLGGGLMHDLRQAIVRDESGILKGLLEDFIAETDEEARKAIPKELVFAWSGVEDINPGSRGGLIDARELEVLEKYSGSPFMGSDGPNPHAAAVPVLKQTYETLMGHFYRNLQRQTDYAGYFGALENFNIVAAIDYVRSNIFAKGMTQEESLVKLRELVWIMEDPAVSLENSRNQMTLLETILWFASNIGGVELIKSLADEIQHQKLMLGLKEGKNYIQGSGGDDTIIGANQDNLIYGGAGSDQIFGDAGDDTIIGGKGDDYIEGGGGKNTYIFALGGGNDTINDHVLNKYSYGLNSGGVL